MNMLKTHRPLLSPAYKPTETIWWAQLGWVVAAAILGLIVSALFAGLFHLARNIYLIFYVICIGGFLLAYAYRTRLDLVDLFRQHWVWGVSGGVIVGYLVVQATLRQPVPRSPTPQGLELVFDLIWLGVIYGLVDGLLLSILPVYATWTALSDLGWTAHWPGRLIAGTLALVASLLVIALYHLGYPEFRSPQLLLVIAGVGIQSLFYLLSRNPIAPLISHVAMHITAVLYGLQTFSQLPPHY
jgi:membrane protease YdiL (CAAX protease family)